MNSLKQGLMLASIVSIAGCSTQSAVESDFGNSVRNMVEQQTAHPERFVDPDLSPVDGTDAARLENVMQTYRDDVSKPEAITEEIRVGSGRRN